MIRVFQLNKFYNELTLSYNCCKILFILLILNVSLAAQSYEIPWSSFSSGFTKSFSGNNYLTTLLGEPLTGSGISGDSRIKAGFFANQDFISTTTQVNSGSKENLPAEYELEQNYPNPFNPSTTIEFSLPQISQVTIQIYDVLGRRIKTLINGLRTPGNYKVQWNGDSEIGTKVSSGIYFYSIKALGSGNSNFLQYKKMILLK